MERAGSAQRIAPRLFQDSPPDRPEADRQAERPAAPAGQRSRSQRGPQDQGSPQARGSTAGARGGPRPRPIRLGRPFGPGFALRPGLIAPHVETPAPAKGRHRQRAGQDSARPGRKRPAAPAGQRSRPQDKPPPFSSGEKSAPEAAQRKGVPPPDRALPALRVDSRAGPRPTPANPTRKRAGNPLQGTPRRYASTHSTKTQRHGLVRKKRRGRRQGSRAGPIRRTCDAGKEGRARKPPGWIERGQEAEPRAGHAKPSEGGITNGAGQSRNRAA